MNSFIGIGRLTKDCELKYTTSNKAVASFSIAITRTFKNTEGETEADFINCECWGQVAETLSKYTHKGDLIAVNGSIRTDKYQDSNGNNKTRTYILVNRIQFLSTKKVEEKTKLDREELVEYPF
jgi:single-strand DNA-binding protein